MLFATGTSVNSHQVLWNHYFVDVKEAGKNFNTVIDKHQLEPFTASFNHRICFSNTEAEGQKVYSDQNLALMNKGKKIEKAQTHPDTPPNVSSQLSEILVS